MVRYSKLAFRETVRTYDVDLCWTPMILAKEFCRSERAREADFTTSPTDTPLILQFGANDPLDLSRATTLVSPFVSGVDLNCGCPQSWASAECIGAALMNHPELTSNLIKSMKSALPADNSKTVSAKIRIHHDLRQTTDFITMLESAGVDFITVHGRKKSTPSHTPVNLDAVRICKSHAKVPVIANGDVFDLDDAALVRAKTGVDGVMAARGILENPAMFDPVGQEGCTWSVVDTFLNHVVKAPLPFKLVMHHLSEMTGNSPDHSGVSSLRKKGGEGKRKALLTRKERAEMMLCRSMCEVIDWLDEKRRDEGGIRRDGDGYLKALS